MAEANQETIMVKRHRRVQLIKKLIFIFLAGALLVPNILCLLLLVRMNSLSKELALLKQELSAEAVLLEDETAETAAFTASSLKESSRKEVLPEQMTVQADGTMSKQSNSEQSRKIYLTFDDGPSSNTDTILDILAAYNVKATFFVVGKTDEHSKQIYRRIVEEGHTLGMHSYSHKYGEIYASVDSFSQDLTRLQEYLYEETGVWPRYCRFPGGSSNTVSQVDMSDLTAYLNRQNITYFDWNIASGDAVSGHISKQSIIDNCLSTIEGVRVGIILLHDAAEKNTTVEALPAIIEGIQALENTEILPINDETVPIQHIISEE